MTSVAQAQLLLKQGRIAEAEREFAAVLEVQPDSVPALNVMALVALRNHDLEIALARINAALRADPGNPLTLHNHGRILQAAQRYEDAIDSQRKALNIAPTLHAARLHLGQALELSGRSHLATVAYARALHDAQRDGRWLNASTTPPAFAPLVEHAAAAVRRGRKAAMAELLRPLMATYGYAALRRVEKSLRGYFHEETTSLPHSGQRPTFFHFLDVPSHPYLDRALFEWIDSMEAMHGVICSELVSLLPRAEGREAVFGNAALEADHLRGLQAPPSWNGYYFYRHSERRSENCERCPATAAALDALPLCRVREHGPEVLFSVFTPGTHLLPHRGVTNTRVVAHLPLIIPEDCALVVGGVEHRWTEGKIVVFDDTYEHEAWNRSANTRVVLIFDLWSPYLTEAERAAVCLIIGDIGDFGRVVEAS